MIDAIFLVAVGLIWVTLLHALTMAVAGVSFGRQVALGPTKPVAPAAGWPGVSLLIPAHDEERVIERTLQACLALDYPRDRLQVVLIDDASTDRTGAIADRLAAADPRLTVIHVPRAEGGQGKAVALNRGLARCRHEVIAVYDADERPEPEALRWLVSALRRNYVAAVGRIVKWNRRATLLNRLSWLDFVSFQWTFQAGRSRLFDVVLLTGTNYVVRADVVRGLGGWDAAALTEDLELSVRIYCEGGRVAFVPQAVSREEDPQRLRVWVRQRTRWLIGNYYVLFRRTGAMLRSRRPRAYIVLWEMVALYFSFLVALVLSQLVFVGSLAGVVDLGVEGPLLLLWLLAFLGFLVPLHVATVLEREESWSTPLLGLVMYVFYGPLWLFVFVRALAVYGVRRENVRWAKTPRTGS